MRIFLRNKQTRLYCSGPGAWSAPMPEALLFAGIRQAAKFGLNEKVPNAEIVLRFDLLDQEVTVPLLAYRFADDDPRSRAA